MKKMDNLVLLLLLFAVLGCTPKIPRGGAETESQSQVETPPLTENNMPMEMETEGWDEELGEKELKGRLTTTKGGQAMLEGVILDVDFFGEDWRKKVNALNGKRVEAKGKLLRHHCGSMEQCLSQGYIDSLYDMEYVREL